MSNTTFDERTEKNLAKLHPGLNPMARKFLEAAQAALPAGITIKIISALRTYEEQDDLYQQGRHGHSGKVVTNAPAGYSWHNFDEHHGSIAFDIGLFRGNDYLEESPSYRRLGSIGVGVGLEWGGNWDSFPDTPHYQLPLSAHGITLAKARERYAAGIDVAAGTPYAITQSETGKDINTVKPAGWSIVVDGKTIREGIVSGENGTGIARDVATALGASVGSDGANKRVLIVRPVLPGGTSKR